MANWGGLGAFMYQCFSNYQLYLHYFFKLFFFGTVVSNLNPPWTVRLFVLECGHFSIFYFYYLYINSFS